MTQPKFVSQKWVSAASWARRKIDCCYLQTRWHVSIPQHSLGLYDSSLLWETALLVNYSFFGEDQSPAWHRWQPWAWSSRQCGDRLISSSSLGGLLVAVRPRSLDLFFQLPLWQAKFTETGLFPPSANLSPILMQIAPFSQRLRRPVSVRRRQGSSRYHSFQNADCQQTSGTPAGSLSLCSCQL